MHWMPYHLIRLACPACSDASSKAEQARCHDMVMQDRWQGMLAAALQ